MCWRCPGRARHPEPPAAVPPSRGRCGPGHSCEVQGMKRPAAAAQQRCAAPWPAALLAQGAGLPQRQQQAGLQPCPPAPAAHLHPQAGRPAPLAHVPAAAPRGPHQTARMPEHAAPHERREAAHLGYLPAQHQRTLQVQRRTPAALLPWPLFFLEALTLWIWGLQSSVVGRSPEAATRWSESLAGWDGEQSLMGQTTAVVRCRGDSSLIGQAAVC